MKINEIKKEFPIFKQKIRGKPLIYLDSANPHKTKSGNWRDIKILRNWIFKRWRSVHTLAVKATNKFKETRDLENFVLMQKIGKK